MFFKPFLLDLFALYCRFHKSFKETSLPTPSHNTYMAQRWVWMSLNITPRSVTSPSFTCSYNMPLTNHTGKCFLLSKIHFKQRISMNAQRPSTHRYTTPPKYTCVCMSIYIFDLYINIYIWYDRNLNILILCVFGTI